MAKPTSDPTWATDAAYASDGDAWGGDANKVDPGAPRRAEGVEPDVFPAEWLNYHLNALGEHTEYLHAIVEADGSESIPAVTRTVIVHPFEGRLIPLGATGLVSASAGIVGTGYNLELSDTDLIWVLPLNRFVPFGAIVTQIDMMIEPGTHSTPGTFARKVATAVFGTPSIGAYAEEDSDATSGTSLQLLTLATDFTLDTNNEMHVLTYTVGGLSSGVDKIESIRIQYTDPGPRNF